MSVIPPKPYGLISDLPECVTCHKKCGFRCDRCGAPLCLECAILAGKHAELCKRCASDLLGSAGWRSVEKLGRKPR